MYTLGIPCIYYSRKQQFNSPEGSDKYICKTIFGGGFGVFRSKNIYCFNDKNLVYWQVAEVAAIRHDSITLPQGLQYLCEVSGDGVSFSILVIIAYHMRSMVPRSMYLCQ